MKSDFLEKFKGKANKVSKQGYSDLFGSNHNNKSRVKDKSKSKSPHAKHRQQQSKKQLKKQLKSKTQKQNRPQNLKINKQKISSQSQKDMNNLKKNKNNSKAHIKKEIQNHKKQNIYHIKQNINPKQNMKNKQINLPKILKLPPITGRQNKLVSQKYRSNQKNKSILQGQKKLNYSFQGIYLDNQALQQLQNLNKFAQRIQERYFYTKNRGITLHY